MAFILKKTASLTWPVTVKKGSNGGKFKEYKFNAVFKEVGRERFNELIDEGDEALGEEILLGWEGIQDEAKAEIPFNPENKKALLDDFTVMKAIITAYGEMITGGSEKN